MKKSMAGGLIISAVLLALVMPQSAAALGAYAQTPSTSPLTVEALGNAMYQPFYLNDAGDTVRLVDGKYAGTLPDAPLDPVDISQRSYAFGDLNGDGVDDAVAVVVELLATSGRAGLAAYLNDSGAPILAGSIELGVSTEVDSVTVASGTITVTGLQVGGNDALCCPSQPFQRQFVVQGNQLVEAPSAAPTVAQSVSIALKSFPGTVLVLPADQPPFARWPLQGVRLNDGPGYLEYAGDPIQRLGSDVVSIEASVGQVANDPRTDFKPTCQPATPYCYFPPFGQSGGAERFNGLKARGNDAFVLHTTFPSERWSLFWFDKSANTSYTLTFGGDHVVTLFEPLGTFDKSNVTAAQNLAALADKLTPSTAP
jgi:hypothetical protein